MHRSTGSAQGRKPALLIFSYVMFALACRNDATMSPLHQLLSTPTEYTLVLSSEATHAPLLSARFTEAGDHIVVLSGMAPFVKVFARNGSLERSFLPKGGGPEEMLAPYALATKGDSLLLVVDVSGSVRVYTLQGKQIASARIPMQVSTVASACESKWVLIGPYAANSGAPPSWIHELSLTTVGDTALVRSWLPQDPSPAWRPTYGRPHGITEKDGRISFLMDFVQPATVGNWDCSSEHLASTPIPAWEDDRVIAEGRETESKGRAQRVLPGTRVSGGIARVGGFLIISAFTIGSSEKDSRTLFRLIGEGKDIAADVPGVYTFLDTKPGAGILLLDVVNERVFAVDERDFVQALISN